MSDAFEELFGMFRQLRKSGRTEAEDFEELATLVENLAKGEDQMSLFNSGEVS